MSGWCSSQTASHPNRCGSSSSLNQQMSPAEVLGIELQRTGGVGLVSRRSHLPGGLDRQRGTGTGTSKPYVYLYLPELRDLLTDAAHQRFIDEMAAIPAFAASW